MTRSSQARGEAPFRRRQNGRHLPDFPVQVRGAETVCRRQKSWHRKSGDHPHGAGERGRYRDPCAGREPTETRREAVGILKTQPAKCGGQPGQAPVVRHRALRRLETSQPFFNLRLAPEQNSVQCASTKA